MKKLFLTLTLCLWASNVFGTVQIRERLVFEGQTLAIDGAPLEPYFDAEHPRPEKELKAFSTACWRGYIGTWLIKDGFLCLKSLERDHYELDEDTNEAERRTEEIPLSRILEGRKAPAKATWFTGVLHASRGEELHPYYDSVYPLYTESIYVTVHKGRVTSSRVVDNRAEGATRSHRDWRWVLRTANPVKDDRQWHDARLIATPAFQAMRESGKTFTTRGILTNKIRSAADHLWIPKTPTTEYERIDLHRIPKNVEPAYSAHVEIEAHFEKVGDDYNLIVDSLRPLKPGETIHHPSFKPAAKNHPGQETSR